MKDSHLTVRLPLSLARAMTRFARARGLSKSDVAREAVTRFLGHRTDEPAAVVTAGEVARRWASLPRLTAAETASFEADLVAARASLPTVRTPWA